MTFPFLTSASCLSPAPGSAGRCEQPWAKRGAERQGRGWEEEGPWLGSGRGARAGQRYMEGSGCHKDRRQGCFKEGQKGQLTVVKRRKGNIVEIGARNQAKKRKGQN